MRKRNDICTEIEIYLFKCFVSQGDVLSSEAGNSIPLLAIIYAAVSSLNSVGVSVYQEQLFKVNQIMSKGERN